MTEKAPEKGWVEEACKMFDAEAHDLGWGSHVYSKYLRDLTTERDALAAEVERLRGNLEDAASAVEWGARRMETQSYKVLMEKWASEYRAALEEGKGG